MSLDLVRIHDGWLVVRYSADIELCHFRRLEHPVHLEHWQPLDQHHQRYLHGISS